MFQGDVPLPIPPSPTLLLGQSLWCNVELRSQDGYDVPQLAWPGSPASPDAVNLDPVNQ